MQWWQSQLRLRDWEIDISYVDDLEHEDFGPVYGLCDRFPHDRRATILIRTPKSASDLAEVEDTVVHELLHCLLAPLAGREEATRTAEEQAVWAIAPLLVELGESRQGRVLARAMARAGMRTLAAGRTRSSSRRNKSMLDPKIAELLKRLLEMQDPEGMKAAITAALETLSGGEGEGAGDLAADTSAKDEGEADAGVAAAEEEGGQKPYLRAAPGKAASLAVQALLAATRVKIEAPRKSKEERARELRLPKDIAALAVKLPDDEFDDYVRQVEPMLRASGPARTTTQGEGAGRGGGSAPRNDAMARLPADQRSGLTRVFGARTAKPAAARTADGRLVLSHFGSMPDGSSQLGGKDGK
ncbi:hypothetical protein [Sorangium sp. So ce362]|uniref:hypothetical protein n=1 Tax=Sorangium sp. So ce362 TaxID=3133303 RepID=UPI003F5E493E